MPKLLPGKYAKILYAVTNEAKDIPAAVTSFAKFLKRRRATKKLPIIITEFLNLVREKQGILNVKVTTARVMSENKIVELVKKIFDSDVALETHIDEGIVGGIILETNTHRYDATVKNQLLQLSNHLSQKK